MRTIRFEATFTRGKDQTIEECMLEIIAYHEEEDREYQLFTIDLNRQEVKQLLDLMQEAYAKMSQKSRKHRNFQA